MHADTGTRALASVLLPLGLALGQACGPHGTVGLSSASHRVEWSIKSRNVAFDLGGVSGGYTEIAAHAGYRPAAWGMLGLDLPIDMLRVASGHRFGLGDPSGFAQAHFPTGAAHRLAAGMQISAPLGNRAAGLGSGHFIYAPYLSWDRTGAFHGSLLLGAALSRAENPPAHAEHGAAHGTAYLHPHGNREAHVRLTLGRDFGPVDPTLSISGQSVLEDRAGHAPGDLFLTLGAEVPMRMGPATLLTGLHLPISKDRRQAWQMSLGIGGGW